MATGNQTLSNPNILFWRQDSVRGSSKEDTMIRTADNDNFPSLISLNEACRMTSMSRSMLNRYRSEGRFPVAVELGDRRVAFVRSEIQAWVEAKIAARASA
jgi:prophage regulatory protein